MTIRPMRLDDASAVATLSGELGHPASAEEPHRMVASSTTPTTTRSSSSSGRGPRVIHVGVRRTLHKAAHAEIVALVIGAATAASGSARAAGGGREVGGRARPRDGSLRSREDRRDAHRFYELGYAKESLSYNLSRGLSRAR